MAPTQAPTKRNGSAKHGGSRFAVFSRWAARTSGHPVTFMVASAMIVVWLVSGPVFHFSNTWQLVINTTTTIITFLMVFLIQNTQNRDTEAMQLKLDEVIRAIEGAHNELLDLEDLDEAELEAVRQRYAELARTARQDLEAGRLDTAVREVRERAKRGETREPGRRKSRPS